MRLILLSISMLGDAINCMRKATRAESGGKKMKYITMNRKQIPMNLQLFAEKGEGADGGEAGEGDDPEDLDEGGEEVQDDKKYTEKDVEEAVKKRLARERRRWQRQQEKPAEPETPAETDKDTEELMKKAARAEEMELKWTCLEHNVKKDCVDDVLALAKVHMAKGSEDDIEDAIDAVIKKYPHFKEGNEPECDPQDDKRGWGQRHDKAPKNAATVDDEIRKQLFGK